MTIEKATYLKPCSVCCRDPQLLTISPFTGPQNLSWTLNGREDPKLRTATYSVYEAKRVSSPWPGV